MSTDIQALAQGAVQPRLRRLLIVDDDATLRQQLARTLTSQGFQVELAATGDAAMEQLSRPQCFDVVLMDLTVPGMDPVEMIAEVHGKGCSARVIAMGAHDTCEDVIRAVKMQAFDYLHKPFTDEALITAVESTLLAPAVPPIKVVSARHDWIELLVPCDLPTAERIQGFIDRMQADLPDNVRDSMGRAFRELLLNAIEWGGHLDPMQMVRISCIRTRRMILYRITDPGPGFKFSDVKHAAINNPENKPLEHQSTRDEKGMRAGGFGILLARAIVDELIYNERQNEVVFVKYLD